MSLATLAGEEYNGGQRRHTLLLACGGLRARACPRRGGFAPSLPACLPPRPLAISLAPRGCCPILCVVVRWRPAPNHTPVHPGCCLMPCAALPSAQLPPCSHSVLQLGGQPGVWSCGCSNRRMGGRHLPGATHPEQCAGPRVARREAVAAALCCCLRCSGETCCMGPGSMHHHHLVTHTPAPWSAAVPRAAYEIAPEDISPLTWGRGRNIRVTGKSLLIHGRAPLEAPHSDIHSCRLVYTHLQV